MMKSNFLISAHRSAPIPGSKRLFVADPYIAHVLEREGRHSMYESVDAAQALRTTRGEFERDHEYVDRKYRQYTTLLVRRLDELHGTCHGESFWRKALSLALLRHVTLCHDVFRKCESSLDPAQHECRVLDERDYYVPADFDDHRRVFQNTEFGQEQLFSIYCRCFHPGRFVTWRGEVPVPAAEGGVASKPASAWLDRLRRITLRKLASRLLRWRSPRLGILNAYFSAENLERLMIRSLGRINILRMPVLPVSASAPHWAEREKLVREEPGFDRFDTFVFSCLLQGMPRLFVEDFVLAYARLDAHFSQYKDLRWVACEAWIGHTHSALALAVLGQRGVKHLYNEHNYLSHFFEGNCLKYLAPLVDEFVTLGWEDAGIPNLVRGASLFQWVEPDKGNRKAHEILFVLGLPITHVPEVNAAYGDSGAHGAVAYLDMNRRFLGALDEKTLGRMYVRAYPSWKICDWLKWDQAFALAPYLRKAKAYDDVTLSGRVLMQQSRLVVVNYLSTAYLESIIADIPTVFLWNRDTYLFDERHQGFFDVLIGVGICQTEPEAAAAFVDRIKDDPEGWWHSPVVREGRRMFLEANIGEPEVMMRHLLAKAV